MSVLPIGNEVVMCENVRVCNPVMSVDNGMCMLMKMSFDHCVIYNKSAADKHKCKAYKVYSCQLISVYEE